MNSDPQKTAHGNRNIDATLRRYVEIQKQEQALKEEKAGLQVVLAEHMKRIERDQWYPDVDGVKLKVRCRESTSVDYNEGLLRHRLGDRYSTVLVPDIRKIRQCLGEIAPLLQPVLARIGSPTPETVHSAIEAGVAEKSEFAGAFEKTVKRYVSVARTTSESRDG